MRFDRVPFGNKSSADSEQEAYQMFTEARKVMLEAKFSLSKWESNSKEVSQLIYKEFESKHLDNEPIKVLGMKWIPHEDSFSYEVLNIPADFKITKRSILSCIARLFDPLGFLTPFVMLVKFIFQELWIQGIEWDEKVPQDIEIRFNNWLKCINLLQDWKIPRSFTNLQWGELPCIEIHGFGDASEKGYGACVYIKACKEINSPTVFLVVSKGKMTFVLKALHCNENVKYKCWTDSTVSLAWIKGNACKWKPFVSNRVSEIQSLTDPSNWYHCSSKDNPADLVTRGLLAKDLMQSELWMRGPKWLSEELLTQEEMLDDSSLIEENNCLDQENTSPSSTLTVQKSENILEIERWSSFTKIQRIVGWMFRFINNASKTKENKKGNLDFTEMNQAKLKLFSYVQNQEFSQEIKTLKEKNIVEKKSSLIKLNPFIGQDNLLRIKGRLQLSELSTNEKHPIILPSSHLTLLLVTFQHKLMKHAGVNTMISALRNTFWIIGLRRLAKRVKKRCVFCQRYDSKACTQPVAPLPELRVTKSSPFAVAGLDYTGPLYCSDYPNKKFYVLLFTCAVVRAVHLELVNSLSLKDFMCAFRRFSSRRGLPLYLYSDNAATFKAARFQLQNEYGHLSPKWKYIVPFAPWWGGWWERLMRPIKSSLKKSIGRKLLNRTELETVLQEIEACLNSRPLTFVGDEIDSGEPLTPFHFLIGKSTHLKQDGQLAYIDTPVTQQNLIENNSIHQQLLKTFWQKWQLDYLRNLPPLLNSKTQGNIKKGTIVIINEMGIPRMRWPLGIVEKVYCGKDGLVRSVDLQTAKGRKTRPIQRLHNLEIVHQLPENCDESDVNVSDKTAAPRSDEESVLNIKKSRYGRVIKPRTVLDL
ncbi:hypothetical protein GQR58_005883 [Nymphon striatum]|nr:hypothetical protein GQR58_005883 [Nymphon striatum]